MIQFKSIGILLRDNRQEFPLPELKSYFKKFDPKFHILKNSLPDEELDLIIAMGGDGTVLHALQMIPNCPVLAVNFGTIGFLTAGDQQDLEKIIMRLLDNNYIISERMLLRCDYRQESIHAVNEVVLRSTRGMINVDVFVNKAKIRTIRGDGVIVGTPTGSTGYLLSTGAPVVMPDVNCLIVDGINEYNFSSRALILPPHSVIRLYIPSIRSSQKVQLMVDGREKGKLEAGEEILLTQSQHRVQMIFFEGNYFFHNLSSRLAWI